MNLSFLEPRPALKAFVRCIWIFESAVGLPLAEQSVVTPTGGPRLILACENAILSRAKGREGENRDHTLYLLGVRDVPVTLYTRPGRTLFIGVDFSPQGAHALLKVPMFELTNRATPLADLISVGGSPISEDLWSCATAEEKVDSVQDFLCQRLSQDRANPIVDYCVAAIERSSGGVSVQDLAERSGYSRRYLEMLFQNHVGITPKRLASIIRFQSVYRSWAAHNAYGDILGAASNRYYDQAHFVRHFKQMTGFPPHYFTSNVPNEFGRRLTVR